MCSVATMPLLTACGGGALVVLEPAMPVQPSKKPFDQMALNEALMWINAHPELRWYQSDELNGQNFAPLEKYNGNNYDVTGEYNDLFHKYQDASTKQFGSWSCKNEVIENGCFDELKFKRGEYPQGYNYADGDYLVYNMTLATSGRTYSGIYSPEFGGLVTRFMYNKGTAMLSFDEDNEMRAFLGLPIRKEGE